MLTQAPPIFKTTPRQAEQADARPEIRRDDKEEQSNKKQRDRPEPKDNSFWEDSNSVSVEALKAFLTGFLREQEQAGSPANKQNPAAPDLRSSADHNAAQRTGNPMAAQAAKAYAATAAHAEADHPHPVAEMEEKEPDETEEQLQSSEMRTIHALILDLNVLEKHNVHTLTILKADTFLEALVLAVNLQKQQLSL